MVLRVEFTHAPDYEQIERRRSAMGAHGARQTSVDLCLFEEQSAVI